MGHFSQALRVGPIAVAGERSLPLLQRFDQRECLLELAAAPLERLELGAFARERCDELLDLGVLRERDAAQMLDVLLSLEIVRLHDSLAK